MRSFPKFLQFMIRERDRLGQSKLKMAEMAEMADCEGMWGTANIRVIFIEL